MINKTTKKQSKKADINFVVEKNDIQEGQTSCELLEYLYVKLSNLPKKKVKSFLTHKEVFVNNKATTQYNYHLKVGQKVDIRQNAFEYKKEEYTFPLEILYEDEELIVINKPAGLLSMATESEKERTAYHMLMEYVKRENSENRVYIVHRLDRETSGVLMVAKNEEIKMALQDNWGDIVSYRGYLAIVEGKLKEKSGRITQWLKETSTHFIYSVEKDKYALEAITNYEVVSENDYYSLVSVWLETGRKNQIRVCMKDMGNSIAGDKKYGAVTNPMRRLLLHAHKLVLTHPYTNEEMTFECNFENKALKLASQSYKPK